MVRGSGGDGSALAVAVAGGIVERIFDGRACAFGAALGLAAFLVLTFGIINNLR